MSTKQVVGYFNGWVTQDELSSRIEGYTHVLFSFWVDPEQGVAGAAEAAVANNNALIKYVQSQGKKCMLAAGGGTYTPDFGNTDNAREYGLALAKYALDHGYDGVDFDIENIYDFATSLPWLAAATNAASQYASENQKSLIISHAPQAPYFHAQGQAGYGQLEAMTQGCINFYNIQYYNQGNDAYQAYDTFNKIFPKTYDGAANNTAIESISANGIPGEKLIVGKPITSADVGSAGATGYISEDKLAAILFEAQKQGISFGGVMGWKIDSDIDGQWGKAMNKTLNS